MLVDGQVTEEEVTGLGQWLTRNPSATASWPGNVIAQRLREVLDDGIIEEDERASLRTLMEDITGFRDGEQRPHDGIYTEPGPVIKFEGKSFVLTGDFVFGPRRKVEQAIVQRGGVIVDKVRQNLDYLLVGSIATAAWATEQAGTKILKAVEWNAKEKNRRFPPIAIVAEEHWTRSVLATAPE